MKYKLCIFFLCIHVNIYTQTDTIVNYVNGTEAIRIPPRDSLGLTNLYEYGKPITSCECNFENLFQNWNRQIITNAHETQLISYEYVETIADTLHLKYYRKLFFGKNLFGGIKMSMGSQSGSNVQNDRFFYINTGYGFGFDAITGTYSHKQLKRYYEEVLNPLEEGFLTKGVHIGDKVYVIKIKLTTLPEDYDRIYNVYVICSAKNNRIVWDNVFGYTSIPVSKVKLYEWD
jgi:hypothetical protein